MLAVNYLFLFLVNVSIEFSIFLLLSSSLLNFLDNLWIIIYRLDLEVFLELYDLPITSFKENESKP